MVNLTYGLFTEALVELKSVSKMGVMYLFCIYSVLFCIYSVLICG